MRRHLVPHFVVPLGGSGGGVQVLDVTEARGRTFEQLFVMGLARDAFPRSVREDPLLPDALRERVRDVLPDVPVKKLGHDEERYLFAELVASSPQVTLSWPLASDEGRPCARSSFVERLRWAGAFAEPALARSVLAPAPSGPAQLLSLEEHVLRAALFGPPQRLDAVFPIALRGIAGEILERGPASAVDPLAASRLAVLREVEGKAFRGAPQLGPYYRLRGTPARGERSPRGAALRHDARAAVALRLADLSRAAPAPRGAPRCRRRAAGNRHAAARLGGSPSDRRGLPRGGRSPGARARGRRPLARRRAAGGDRGKRPRWRSSRTRAFRSGASRACSRSGRFRIVLRARSLDQAEPAPIEIVAVERERSIDVADARGRAHALCFRADRIERIGGRERLTDFKTGRPISKKKTEATRRADFIAAVARGEVLQPVAYARSTQGEGSGRLLYLRPDLSDDMTEFSAPRGDVGLGEAFDTALHGLFDAWNAGSFFPRLLGPDLDQEPTACQFCAVAQACLRGDTGARRRFAAWLEASENDREPRLAVAELSLLRLFRLGAAPDAEAEDAS